jgi:hypothetical protein
MKWGDLGKKIGGLGLPALGGALGGPGGALIGKLVAEKLGMPGANPEAIAQAVTDDPAALVKLAEIEATSDVQLAELEVRDRMDARTHIRDDRMRRILALALPGSALFFGTGLIIVLVRANEITQAVGMAGTILGWLIRDASAATSFFFGSSVGSSRKATELENTRK